MPWCPKCKSEYREEFSKCDECNVDLENELKEHEDEAKVDYGPLVFLVSVGNNLEFNMIESELKRVGIPVLKNHKETGAYLDVIMGSNPFGHDVLVPQKLFLKAKEIIDTINFENIPEELLEDIDYHYLEEQDFEEQVEIEEDIHDVKDVSIKDKSRFKKWITFLLLLGSAGLIILLVMKLLGLNLL